MVSKAGKLLQSRINELALCITYPESAIMSGLPIFRVEKKEKVLESSVRFSTKEVGHPVLTATDVAFSVNKPITIHGLTLYGGAEQSYSYKVTVLLQGKTVTSSEGRFSQGDYYGDGYVNVLLKNTVKLEVNAANWAVNGLEYVGFLLECPSQKRHIIYGHTKKTLMTIMQTGVLSLLP